MTFTIRPADPEELDAVGRITVEAYTKDGYLDTDADYAHQLADASGRADDAEVWVAVDETGVLGSVTFCPVGSAYQEVASGSEGEFRMLSVAAVARRRGVAEALVNQCILRSRELEYDALALCSMEQMHTAHRLYRRLGFVPTPERDWSPVPGVFLVAFRLDLTPVE